MVIKCNEFSHLTTTIWALSVQGGKIFHQSKSDTFVVDPFGTIDFQDLYDTLKDFGRAGIHGWKEEDILIAPATDQSSIPLLSYQNLGKPHDLKFIQFQAKRSML